METVSDRYKIVQKLGKQSKRKFGSVFLVQNKLSGEEAILKTLKKNPNNFHLQERIRQEAGFSFEFDGLPKTLELIENESEILLIKNYIPGITLEEYWRKIPRKDQLSELILILENLSPILHYLKEVHVIHCDIKASNILIHKMNSGITVSLIDFGLALKQDKENQRSILFPLGYAAPELLLNKLDLVDHRTDLFSIGIMIWTLLNGQLPLTHPNPSIFTNLQLTHPLPEGTEPLEGLNKLLRKMCCKPSFRTAPNRMDNAKVRSELLQAIHNRYENLNQFLDHLKKLPKRKKWIFF